MKGAAGIPQRQSSDWWHLPLLVLVLFSIAGGLIAFVKLLGPPTYSNPARITSSSERAIKIEPVIFMCPDATSGTFKANIQYAGVTNSDPVWTEATIRTAVKSFFVENGCSEYDSRSLRDYVEFFCLKKSVSIDVTNIKVQFGDSLQPFSVN